MFIFLIIFLAVLIAAIVVLEHLADYDQKGMSIFFGMLLTGIAFTLGSIPVYRAEVTDHRIVEYAKTQNRVVIVLDDGDKQEWTDVEKYNNVKPNSIITRTNPISVWGWGTTTPSSYKIK